MFLKWIGCFESLFSLQAGMPPGVSHCFFRPLKFDMGGFETNRGVPGSCLDREIAKNTSLSS